MVLKNETGEFQMSYGAQGFDQIHIALSDVARKSCRGDARKIKELEQRTQAFAEAMLSDQRPQEVREISPIFDIDVNATLMLSHRNATPMAASLLDMILTYGRGGELLLDQLLKHIDNPNTPYQSPKSRIVKGKQSRLWIALSRAHQVDYLGCLINDNRLDVEVAGAEGRSLLNHLCAALAARDNPAHKELGGQLSTEQMITYVSALLGRGALLDPYYAKLIEHHLQLYPQLAKAIAPTLLVYQQEWDRFMASGVTYDAVTESDFRHFFSLGRTEAMIQSGRWNQGMEDMLKRLDELPEWVATQCPMQQEYTILYSKMSPAPRISASSLDHVAPLPIESLRK